MRKIFTELLHSPERDVKYSSATSDALENTLGVNFIECANARKRRKRKYFSYFVDITFRICKRKKKLAKEIITKHLKNKMIRKTSQALFHKNNFNRSKGNKNIKAMQCTYIYLSPLEEKLFLNVLFAMHRYVQIILKITILMKKIYELSSIYLLYKSIILSFV